MYHTLSHLHGARKKGIANRYGGRRERNGPIQKWQGGEMDAGKTDAHPTPVVVRAGAGPQWAMIS
jgi:hypothetical protein